MATKTNSNTHLLISLNNPVFKSRNKLKTEINIPRINDVFMKLVVNSNFLTLQDLIAPFGAIIT